MSDSAFGIVAGLIIGAGIVLYSLRLARGFYADARSLRQSAHLLLYEASETNQKAQAENQAMGEVLTTGLAELQAARACVMRDYKLLETCVGSGLTDEQARQWFMTNRNKSIN